MKQNEMETLTSNIQEKLGQESSALIADDIGTLITDNNLMNQTITQKDEEISKLKQDKENLIKTNGNLLQKVAMGSEYIQKPEEKEEKKKFSFKSVFDEKGNFI